MAASSSNRPPSPVQHRADTQIAMYALPPDLSQQSRVFHAELTGVEKVESSTRLGSHCELIFQIRHLSSLIRWSIRVRYSQLYEAHQRLEQVFDDLPELPRKIPFWSRSDESELARAGHLEVYLEQLLARADLRNTPVLEELLDLDMFERPHGVCPHFRILANGSTEITATCRGGLQACLPPVTALKIIVRDPLQLNAAVQELQLPLRVSTPVEVDMTGSQSAKTKAMTSSAHSDEYMERFEPQVINQFQYLPPGDYVLEVTAINALGMLGEATHMDITMPVLNLPRATSSTEPGILHKENSQRKFSKRIYEFQESNLIFSLKFFLN